MNTLLKVGQWLPREVIAQDAEAALERSRDLREQKRRADLRRLDTRCCVCGVPATWVESATGAIFCGEHAR